MHSVHHRPCLKVRGGGCPATGFMITDTPIVLVFSECLRYIVLMRGESPGWIWNFATKRCDDATVFYTSC